jgi:hypothetical protein
MTLAFLLVIHALLAYGLTGSGVLGGVLLFALFARLGGARKALVAAASLAVSTLALAGLIEAADLDRVVNWRPHEVLSVHDPVTGIKRYRKDASLRMDDVPGDLAHMTTEPIARRRSLEFRTDELGFRNDRPFRAQRFLVVGDSFVAGVGNTQAEILTEQLAARHAPDYYNLGYPGDVLEYEAMVDAFPSAEPRVLLFLFEGNDFPEALEAPDPEGEGFLHHYVRMFRDTGIYRVMRYLRKGLDTGGDGDEAGVGGDGGGKGGAPVRIEQTAIGSFAFHTRYVEVTRRAAATPLPELEAALQRMAGRIHRVYFVPTKYRVYQPILWPEETLPHAQWEYLAGVCARLDLRCEDLTPALVRRSLELWPERRLTYWPDDTHWSAEGIAVAADAVHAAVGGEAEWEPRREDRGEAGAPPSGAAGH